MTMVGGVVNELDNTLGDAMRKQKKDSPRREEARDIIARPVLKERI